MLCEFIINNSSLYVYSSTDLDHVFFKENVKTAFEWSQIECCLTFITRPLNRNCVCLLQVSASYSHSHQTS